MTRNVYKILIFVILTKFASCLSPNDLLLSSIFSKNPTEELVFRNTTCANDLLRFYKGLDASEEWAVMMMDSSSASRSGMYSGNLVDFGAYDQCLSILQDFGQNNVVSGQHCMGQVPLYALNLTNYKVLVDYIKLVLQGNEPADADFHHFMLSYCVPNSCSNNELQDIFNTLLNTTELTIPRDRCHTVQTDNQSLGVNWLVVSFFIFLTLVIVTQTLYDVYVRYREIPPKYRGFVAFSVYSNGGIIFTTTESPDHVRCLYGIRVISILWLIFAHEYLTYATKPVENSISLIKWIGNLRNYYIVSSPLAVDSLLTLSGMLATYTIFLAKSRDKRVNLLHIIGHKHARMGPSVMITTMITATLLPYFGSGPLWNKAVVEPLHVPCQTNWHTTNGFFQNYLHRHDFCLPFTWYLAVDMQLFMLSPILLIPLFRWPRYAVYPIFVIIIMGVVSPFLAAPSDQAITDLWMDESSPLNISTHTRFGPWVIGFLFGYFIFRVKTTKINPAVMKYMRIWTTVGWAIAISFLCASLFGGYHATEYNYMRGQSALFMAFRRTMWSLGVSWLAFACAIGYGGPVNWFLSLSFFQIMGRISYPMFLLYHLVQAVIVGQTRSVEHFSNFATVSNFYTSMGFVLVFSIMMSLGVEYPMLAIARILNGPDGFIHRNITKLVERLRRKLKERRTAKEGTLAEL